jgi:uncharacterized protein YbaP (TraB family)
MRRLRLLAILVPGALASLAQPVAQRASGESYQPKLWRLSSTDNAVYLLGSIHVGTPEMYPLPKAIEDAFAASSVLLVETYSPPSDHTNEAVIDNILQETGFYPPNDSLWKHIGKEARRRLIDFCKKSPFLKKGKMRPKDLARIRPWAVALFVDVSPALSRGMDPDLGIDQHFVTEAEHAAAAKRIVGIESAEFQARLLSGFSDDLQVKWLEARLGLDVSGVEAIEEALVADRNVHMAEIAEQFLKGKEQAFMVVGSAHVEGEQGIVRLIEVRGYKVEEVVVPRAN